MKKILGKALRFIAKLAGALFLLSVVTTIIYRFVPPPITPLMVIRCYEQLTDDKKEVRLYKDWTSLDKISDHMPMAVIASEDQKFNEHFGFDVDAIEKAQQYNARHKGKKVRGASTISQQTAKNVFLWPSRSWLRKGLEVYFTFLIEVFWSKERIMEVYLNVIEMGEGVYGAEAASHTYFRKDASKLTKEQSALIAACLPNPRRWSPSRPTGYINKKKDWIVRNMNRMKKPDYLK